MAKTATPAPMSSTKENLKELADIFDDEIVSEEPNAVPSAKSRTNTLSASGGTIFPPNPLNTFPSEVFDHNYVCCRYIRLDHVHVLQNVHFLALLILILVYVYIARVLDMTKTTKPAPMPPAKENSKELDEEEKEETIVDVDHEDEQEGGGTTTTNALFTGKAHTNTPSASKGTTFPTNLPKPSLSEVHSHASHSFDWTSDFHVHTD